MTVTFEGDILLDGKPYLLTAGGHDVNETVRTRPAPPSQPRTLSMFEHQDNYTYFGQSKLLGEGFPTWKGDGPYDIGWGLSLDAEGTVSAADALSLGEADANNPDGWVGFRIGYAAGSPNEDRVVFIGKTDGVPHIKKKVAGWMGALGAWPSPAVSHSFFSRLTIVGCKNGHLYRTDLGTDHTDLGVPDASITAFIAGGGDGSAHLLGALKGRLYVGYADGSIWCLKPDLTWDIGPSRVGLDAGILDMTPLVGALGTNVIYIVTEGPSPRVLFHDGKELFQANTIASDFNPRAAVFFGKLFVFGEQGFDVATKGACWTLSANGLAEELSFGDGTVNEGILTAQIEGEVILWSATGNATTGKTGIGVWDPRLDQSPDAALGFYMSNVATYAAGQRAHGLAALAGKRYVGITGSGLYETTTPGSFFFRTGVYGADQRNMQKLWPQAEVHHTALGAGQSVSVSTRPDRLGTVTLWGASSTGGATTKVIPAPADYRTPYLNVIVNGVAAGLPLTLYDVALAYILTVDPVDVRREWTLKIAVEGFDNPRFKDPTRARQFSRQGITETRTSMQIKADLDALWNKVICFEDLDGKTYKVLVKAPGYHPSAGWPSRFFPEQDRYVDPVSGQVVNLSVDYRLHLIEVGTCP